MIADAVASGNHKRVLDAMWLGPYDDEDEDDSPPST